jgi:uncharacterized protein
VAIKRADFPLPDLDDPLSAPFFAAAARDELAIPRCDACSRYVWYPEAACPADGGALTWEAVSGRATLFSWVVVQRPFLPAFADKVPFVTALVALDEDPAVRLCTYVVDVADDALVPDMPLTVQFRPLEFSTVPGRSVPVPMFGPQP